MGTPTPTALRWSSGGEIVEGFRWPAYILHGHYATTKGGAPWDTGSHPRSARVGHHPHTVARAERGVEINVTLSWRAMKRPPPLLCLRKMRSIIHTYTLPGRTA